MPSSTGVVPKNGRIYMEMGDGYYIDVLAPSNECLGEWMSTFGGLIKHFAEEHRRRDFTLKARAALSSGGWWLT